MERDLLTGLVIRAQKGDRAAMDELFAAFYNDVYFFALKTVKDSDVACDITQETFLEIINTIGNLKEPAAFVTWMKQITYHQCTRHFKKKKDVLVEEDEDGNTIFDTLADEREGSIPSEVYEKEEFRNTILGIINDLTEEQRAAVMMYYFDELSVAQIAEIQSVSEGTVKSRLNYARKAIKKSVENYEKKYNIKLHSFSFLPLFLLFFGKEVMPKAKAAEIGAVVSETAGAVATGSAAGVGGATAVASAGSAVATAGNGIAAKIAAMPIVTKVIAGITAVAVTVGGGMVLLDNAQHACRDVEPNGVCDICDVDVHHGADGQGHWDLTDGDAAYPCIDADMDCTCDICNAAVHYGDKSLGHDYFCTVCGESRGFVNMDEDYFCDICGQLSCGSFHHMPHYDENGDGNCEWCGTDVETDLAAAGSSEHFDLDVSGGGEGYCDHCGVPMCVLGLPTLHWDLDHDCACDECGYVEHFHGQRDGCGHCDTCNKVLGIVDQDGDGICNLCGEGSCGNIHPHADDDGDGYCDFCSAEYNEVVSLTAPYITVAIDTESATLSISQVEGATGYEIRINGSHMGDVRYNTPQISITLTADMLREGENTIIVCAYNDAVVSPDSNTVTVGKLANPEYLATGTGVDLPWGDPENAQGYIIYDEKGEYLATMELGGTYDFSDLYTEDGFYFPYIQAYAYGWISSEKCGIPVSIGSNGGPIGSMN